MECMLISYFSCKFLQLSNRIVSESFADVRFMTVQANTVYAIIAICAPNNLHSSFTPC